MIRYLPFLLVLALWIYAFIDCLNTPEEQVRSLPKAVWVLVILLFGEVLVGPIAWFAAGRPRTRIPAAPGEAPAAAAPGRWVAPDDNPEFLSSLKAENARHESMLKDWEADLRRREEELRRRQQGEGEGTPPVS